MAQLESSSHELFDHVFDEHFRAVSAYALRRTTPAEADDIVAETFLVAWRRLDEVPPNAKPWLLGVARRVLANHRRAAGRRQVSRSGAAAEPGADGSGTPSPAPVLQVTRLSERDREALLLVAWGLSADEAATARWGVRAPRSRCAFA